MSYPRMTLQEQVARVQTLMQQRFPGNGVYRKRSVLWALCYVMGLLMHAAYGYIAWLARQLSDDTSDDDTMEKDAAGYGLTYLSPKKATGNIVVTGLVGTDVAAGRLWQSDKGVIYLVVSDVILTAGTATVAVIAQDAGAAGNLDAGATLTRVNPIPGLDPTAVVDEGGLANGTDKEIPDQLRLRLKQRKKSVPAGGKLDDYEKWVREANADVQKVWPTTELGEGWVSVRFTLRRDRGGPIPAGPVVDAVAAYIETKRPATAHVYVGAPIADPQDFTIHLVPDTAETRTNVTEALDALITNEGVPGGTLPLSHIRNAIGTAGGVYDYTLDITADLSYALGHLPVLGDITWT